MSTKQVHDILISYIMCVNVDPVDGQTECGHLSNYAMDEVILLRIEEIQVLGLTNPATHSLPAFYAPANPTIAPPKTTPSKASPDTLTLAFLPFDGPHIPDTYIDLTSICP